jgi:hypothetical protein
LYAAKELDDVLVLAETIGTATAIVGRVELAGKVIEHDRGYRAELARVAEILPIEGQRARNEPVAHLFGVPIGEEIPASSVSIRRPSRVHRSMSTWRWIGTTSAPRSSGRTRFSPWFLLLFAQITFNHLAAGIDQYHWSDWRLPAALVGATIAIGVWVFIRAWMGRRFSRQLRSFVSAPANMPP